MNTIADQWRAEFHDRYRAAVIALCTDADARMVADPTNCRRIRLEAEQAISTLATTIKPCAGWPDEQRAAFEQWRVEQIVGLALAKARRAE